MRMSNESSSFEFKTSSSQALTVLSTLKTSYILTIDLRSILLKSLNLRVLLLNSIYLGGSNFEMGGHRINQFIVSQRKLLHFVVIVQC